MKEKINFPNPPVESWYPGAPDDKKTLRNYQMYAVAWMELRVEYGGGILGDEIGLGKVFSCTCWHGGAIKIYLTYRPVKY